MAQTDVFTRTVRAAMRKAPVVVASEAGCGELVALMRDSKASSAVVSDASGRPAGIVTEQDVARRITFQAAADAPVSSIMSAPVRVIRDDDYLYHAIARMRREGFRHMPVVDSHARVVGTLEAHAALSMAAEQLVLHIERLTHSETLDGMQDTKAAQLDVASELLGESVPTPDIQTLITWINNDLYRRVVEVCVRTMVAEGHGGPPVGFDVVVMGSGGRGESYLNPDQDNGFILEDYPDSHHARIDAWFIELAEKMTRALDNVGFPFCKGHVMATNPLWRKTLSQWKEQTTLWTRESEGMVLRLCDIFFDFVAVFGDGELSSDLRRHVSEISRRTFFLREMYKMDEKHDVALGFFGRLLRDEEEGPNKGKLNLKMTGTLPLVGAVRIAALRAGIGETSTVARTAKLYAAGVLDADEQDYLLGAFRHITDLILRQQIEDARAGQTVGNHVPVDALSERERDVLVDSLKAIRAFRQRLRAELSGDIFI